MYIILSGKVKVSKNTEDEKERILAIHKSGEFFGEMSLLDGQTEPATVIAKEDCTLMIISKTDFDKLLTNPDFAKQLLMILCQRLRSSWSQMGWLAMVNAAEKTKSALRYLTFHHGFQEGEFIRLKIKLTHAEFGEVAGMSRETVSREFQKLKDEDNLKIEEGHLFIKKSWLEYYPPTMASVSKEEFD
jgi:CRP/FNR family transcriptional regulator